MLVGRQQFELVEQDDDADPLGVDLLQGAVEGAVGSGLPGRLQGQPGGRGRFQ